MDKPIELAGDPHPDCDGCQHLQYEKRQLEFEVKQLKAALLQSPAMAEIIKANPGALRYRTKETDDLRAALAEALDNWDQLDSMHSGRIAELRKLTGEP